MAFVALLLLTVCQFLSGYGILSICKVRLPPAFAITLSILLGIAVASVVPFLLQLCYIVLTGISVNLSLAFVAILLNVPSLLRIRREGFRAFRASHPLGRFRVKAYEIPFLLIMGFLLFVSVWRCYYMPPTSRDALSGPEAIAEYAVREQTMINSFFQVDLWSTNNPFKSPFLISLQIIYKLNGFPFGQIWLSTVVVNFTIFLYHALRKRVHPVIAGLLLILLTITPEVYSYTFMILYDYSNMVFFFLSLYFLFEFWENKEHSHFYLAAVLMGIATYIRSETLVLAILFLPFLLYLQIRHKWRLRKFLRLDAFFILPSLLGYYIPSQIYLKYYLPVHYDIGAQLNPKLEDLHPLFDRYHQIFSRLLTGSLSVELWGYIIYIFFILFLAELVFLRRFGKQARNWLYAIVVLYLGLGLLGWMLPLMTLTDSTKRGLFKLFPLLLLYMASNGWLARLSGFIDRWEKPGR